MLRKLIIASLLLIAIGAGIITFLPKKATAPVAPPLNAHCTIQNHKKDLVCIMNGEAVIGRIYK